jgi:hypothetical protein
MSILCGKGEGHCTALVVGCVWGGCRGRAEVGLGWVIYPTPPPTRYTHRHLTRHVQPKQLTSIHLEPAISVAHPVPVSPSRTRTQRNSAPQGPNGPLVLDVTFHTFHTFHLRRARRVRGSGRERRRFFEAGCMAWRAGRVAWVRGRCEWTPSP